MHVSVPSPTSRRTAVLSALLVGALLVATGGGSAWAVPSQGELDAARSQAGRLEAAVRGAEAELAEVSTQLEVLEEQLGEAMTQLEAAAGRYAAAETAATAASDRARAAENELAEAVGELEENRVTLGELARDTYKYGAQAGSPALAAFEMMDGPSEGLGERLHYLQRGVGVKTAALQASDALRVRVTHLTDRALLEEAELRDRQADAEEQRVAAATLHAEVEDLTSQTSNNVARAEELRTTLEGEQQDVEVRIVELEERVAWERAEAARIERERIERERREREAREREAREREAREQAARELAAREQAEQEQAAREQAAREQAEQERDEARREEQAAARPAASTPSEPAPSEPAASEPAPSEPAASEAAPPPSAPSAPAPSAPTPAASPSTVANSPGPSTSLRTVGGITVASSLAPRLEALLNHARADGVVLGGHGYRSPEVTARLRVVNGCRDVYNAPASSCRVPTARPGTSEHEKGLAVDFTYQGQTICFPRTSANCSNNAGFTWLRDNAGSHGLRNLPTEAWHWSTTGR